jgi:hypothetical protein
VLWVLWLSVGADAAYVNSIVFPTGCGFINRTFISNGYQTYELTSHNFLGTVDTTCREFSGIVAFGFLNWIVRMY